MNIVTDNDLKNKIMCMYDMFTKTGQVKDFDCYDVIPDINLILYIIEGNSTILERKLVSQNMEHLFIKVESNYYPSNKILTIKKNVHSLTIEEKQEIFKLYKISYSNIEKETGREYKTVNELLNFYSDVVYFIKNGVFFGGFLSNKIKNANKISVIVTNGTSYSKQYVYDILAKLLSANYGYILEASGAVAAILKNRYNITSNNVTIIEHLYPGKITRKDNNRYDRQTRNHIVENKELFGKICDNNIHKSWADILTLDSNALDGCNLTFDEFNYQSYLSSFDNLFDGTATLKFLSDDFVPYTDLDSEAIISNLTRDQSIILYDIPDDNSFNTKNNGFALINLYDIPEIAPILDEIKTQLNFNMNKFLHIENDRKTLRNIIGNLALKLVSNKESLKNIFGDNIPEFTDAICVDAVPRDTNPSNNDAKFKGINLVHSDIYPHAYIGDVLWSFRNTWYQKIQCYTNDIEKQQLNNIENRYLWNDKIVGVYNFWISLTDGITDNGLAVLDTSSISVESLIPYKAFRPASKKKDNVNFISSSLTYSDTQKWYTKHNMKFGECFVFNTIGSPHSGFQYINGSMKHRKSVECRVVFLKKKYPSITCDIYQPETSSSLDGDFVRVQ